MASIEKRSGDTYRITVSCGYDSFGKKLRKSKTVTLNEGLTERQRDKELNRLAVLFETEVENGTFLDGNKITLKDFIEKWLEDYAEKNLAPATLHVYKMRLEKRVIPALGHLKLAKIQPHHLIEFYDNLSERGLRLDDIYDPSEETSNLLKKKDHRGISQEIGISRLVFRKLMEGNPTNKATAEKISEYFKLDFGKSFLQAYDNKPLSKNTISHHHKLLSSVLNTAVHWQLIPSNPAQRIKPPESQRTRAESYGEEEILALFNALEKAPINYKAMIYTVIYSGIRLSELAGLTWDNVDFEKKTLTVDKQRMYISGYGEIEKDTKTISGVRTISLPNTVLNLLITYKKHCIEQKLKLGTLWQGEEPGIGYIFLSPNGSPIFPLTPTKWFSEFIKKNNLPKIKFHGLRHSHASILIAEGVDIATVSERLGHSNKTITLNTYTHGIKSKDRDASDKLEELFNADYRKLS